MRFPHHVRMSVTRRGEKELRLAAFIARGLEAVAACAREAELRPAERAVLVIARSVLSPVVRAISALAGEVAGSDCGVRMILIKADGWGMPAALAGEARLARNPRLIEAHEQLVIGARVAWTGDTMRRDPATCDAYESFVEDCPELAVAAAATFERLWGDCDPLSEPVPLAAGAALAPPTAIGPMGLPRRP
jgi:hypothetical protein